MPRHKEPYIDTEGNHWNSFESFFRNYRRKKLREEVYKRDDYKCVECGSSENLTLDHIYPVSKGGATHESNLQTMCHDCNNRKGDKI